MHCIVLLVCSQPNPATGCFYCDIASGGSRASARSCFGVTARIVVGRRVRSLITPTSPRCLLFSAQPRARGLLRASQMRSDPPGRSGSLSGHEMPEGRVPDRIVAAAYRRSAACDAQFERDQAICRTLPLPAIRRSCWTSAMERYAQCGRGGYIPPLNTGR